MDDDELYLSDDPSLSDGGSSYSPSTVDSNTYDSECEVEEEISTDCYQLNSSSSNQQSFEENPNESSHTQDSCSDCSLSEDYSCSYHSSEVTEDYSDDHLFWQQAIKRGNFIPRRSFREIHKELTIRQMFSITQLVQLREVGTKLIPQHQLKNLLILLLVKCQWFPRPENIVHDAIKLLGRGLKQWEYKILDHLLKYGMEKVVAKNHSLEQVLVPPCTTNLTPITFVDYLEVLNNIGVDLSCVNYCGETFIKFMKEYNLKEQADDMVEFVFDKMVDISSFKRDLLMPLCRPPSSTGFQSISNKRLRLIKHLVDIGLRGGKSRANALTYLLKHYYRRANRNAVKVVGLLVDNGFICDQALFTFNYCDYSLSENSYCIEYFENALAITKILVENGARLNPAKNYTEEQCILFELLTYGSQFEHHPSMMELFHLCIAKGLDLKQTDDSYNNRNLLLYVCANYKADDLVDVIELLCRNGIDINYTDADRQNALFALSENKPNYRENVYEAAYYLIENDINIHQTDCREFNVIYYFSESNEEEEVCCIYGKLIKLNETKFWSLLDLFLDAGIKVDDKNSMSGSVVADNLANIISSGCSERLCPDCSRKQNSSGVSLKVHLNSLLSYVERLFTAGAKMEFFSSSFHSEKKMNLLCYVCSKFQGEELLSLVELLCQNGADVNALYDKQPQLKKRRLNKKITINKQAQQPLNAVGVLIVKNSSQIHLLEKLTSLLKSYGFNGSY